MEVRSEELAGCAQPEEEAADGNLWPDEPHLGADHQDIVHRDGVEAERPYERT
ncbi:hypothetical protein D3C83_302020 [compost metagenome]